MISGGSPVSPMTFLTVSLISVMSVWVAVERCTTRRSAYSLTRSRASVPVDVVAIRSIRPPAPPSVPSKMLRILLRSGAS